MIIRYSRSDLFIIVRDASYEFIRKMQHATHFKQIPEARNGKPIYVPCDPQTEGAIMMSLFDMQPEEIQLQPTSMVKQQQTEKIKIHVIQ